MTTVAFIPARCGSQSIKLKNIKPFCGKPLIYWSAKALQDTPGIDQIVIATDCDEIEEVVHGFGFSKLSVYRREAENAQDTSTTESVMIEYIKKEELPPEAIFILVQATSPLTQTADFVNALQKFEEGDSVLTCVRVKRFFWSPAAKPINYDFKNRPRRQDYEGIFMENGAFYINTVERIQRDQNRLSEKIVIYEMPSYTAVELDEPDDWIIAENLMREHILLRSEPETIKLFLTDVDGVLTDAGMYYSESGDELKKFNTHDGKGLELLRKSGIKTGIITSEDTNMVSNRAKKLKVDYLYQGVEGKSKLDCALEICKELKLELREVAYVGDDINCAELLSSVGLAACPANALPAIRSIQGILHLSSSGGEGAVREFAEYILNNR